MSSLSPRVATVIAVTVILPITVTAILHFDVVFVGMTINNQFKPTCPHGSSCDEPASVDKVEEPEESDIAPEHIARSKSRVSLPSARRGPQILGTVPHQETNSRVFAADGDPFTQSRTSLGTFSPKIHSIQQLNPVDSEGTPTLTSRTDLQPIPKQRHMATVVGVPCQPESAIVNRNTSRVEINIFCRLGDLILQPVP